MIEKLFSFLSRYRNEKSFARFYVVRGDEVEEQPVASN
jgi:hypothetical protein